MKKGYHAEVVYNNDLFMGINLGADFTSEHEYGIGDMCRIFGVDISNGLGVKARQITNVPESHLKIGTITRAGRHYTYLIFDNYIQEKEFKVTKSVLSYYQIEPYDSDDNIFTAWDSKSFGIVVSDKYAKELNDLYKSILDKNILLGVGQSQIFGNGGLMLYKVSSLALEDKEKMFKQDKDYENLLKASEKTGIKKILKKADKGYFALRPKWLDENKKEVIFWLNPYNQNDYELGWYTVKDLKDWAKDRGKVLKQK